MRSSRRVVVWLLTGASLAPLAAHASCPPVAKIVRAAINADRAAAALPPLSLSPALCAAAQKRATELAAGNMDDDRRRVHRVTAYLQHLGYRAHAWHERTVNGPHGAAELLETWRERDPTSYRETALGEYQDLGVGAIDDGDGPPVWVLLVATPRLHFEERLARSLADLEAVRTEVLAAVNVARRRQRLPELLPDPRLDEVAQGHAADMLQRRYYDHRGPGGSTPRTRAAALGVARRRFGENIARGIFTPEQVVSRWLGSRDHRRNILSPDYTHLGVGMAYGVRGQDVQVLWVQLFASER